MNKLTKMDIADIFPTLFKPFSYNQDSKKLLKQFSRIQIFYSIDLISQVIKNRKTGEMVLAWLNLLDKGSTTDLINNSQTVCLMRLHFNIGYRILNFN